MKKSISIDVALPRSVYRALHARAGDSGLDINQVLLNAITGTKDTASADTVAFMAQLPRDVHSTLKVRAAQEGKSMKQLVNEACAVSVGIEL